MGLLVEKIKLIALTALMILDACFVLLQLLLVVSGQWLVFQRLNQQLVAIRRV